MARKLEPIPFRRALLSRAVPRPRVPGQAPNPSSLLANAVPTLNGRHTRQRRARPSSLIAGGCTTPYHLHSNQQRRPALLPPRRRLACPECLNGVQGNAVAACPCQLREKITEGHKELEAEAPVLGWIRHPNMLALRVYYLGPKGEKLLVFDYMPKGSLSAFFSV